MMKLPIDPIIPSDKTLIKNISEAVQIIILRSNDKVAEGLDAIMPALIILAWTAFETLAEDLLSAAIKIRPHLLPPATAMTKARKLQSWEQPTLRGGLKTHSGGLKQRPQMSDLNYRTIGAIRDSYWRIFSSDGQLINRVLGNRSLDTLHAARNVLVHKAGRVDSIFLGRVAGIPMFAKAHLDDPLQLDFGMVKNMIIPVLDRGIRLVGAVNTWIQDHK